MNGNAQAIYYLQEDDDPALLGLLVITCSNMTFEFEDQFVSYITPRVSLDWHMYPMDKIPADQPLTLGWFKWQADRRPSKDDVFTRTGIKESQREQYEKIRQPKFAISKKIDARRKRLGRQRHMGRPNRPAAGTRPRLYPYADRCRVASRTIRHRAVIHTKGYGIL